VHGASAGGVLINHLKELMLHTDLKREDRIFYITSCSWMMWNWLLSSLAVGATIVLYDGNPVIPTPDQCGGLCRMKKITVFGTSRNVHSQPDQTKGETGKRLRFCRPSKRFHRRGRPFLQKALSMCIGKSRVTYISIRFPEVRTSNGCFAAGNPISPVYAGELQGAPRDEGQCV